MHLRPFTSSDWHGLAGATRFADGAAPLIGHLRVDGQDAVAVLDSEGLFIEVSSEEGHTVGTVSVPPSHAARAVAYLAIFGSEVLWEDFTGIPGATLERTLSPFEHDFA